MAPAKLLVPLLLVSLLSMDARATEIPASVVEECTTTATIYYPTRIGVKGELTREQKADAVMDALTGVWNYEYDTEDAVYAGYHVRQHYLKFAIVFTDAGLTTIICDSHNMKQRKNSIHRKAPGWKEKLNSKIREKISIVSRNLKSGRIYLKNLTELHRKGYVTEEEYEAIKARIPVD